MSGRNGKKNSGDRVEEEASGGGSGQKRSYTESEETRAGGSKARDALIAEALEKSSMTFSPSKALRPSTESSPQKKGKTNVTTEKHHMKVKVFQVVWDSVNSTTELVTVQNVPSKDLTGGLKGNKYKCWREE